MAPRAQKKLVKPPSRERGPYAKDYDDRRKNTVLKCPESSLAAWKNFHAREKGRSVEGGQRSKFASWARSMWDAAAEGRLRIFFTDRQINRGRDSATEETVRYQYKISEAELESYAAAADAQDLDRSEWQRQVLDAVTGNNGEIAA